MENHAALTTALTAHFRSKTTQDWMVILEAVAVPAGPVLSIAEMLAHPQTLARAMVVETESPMHGRVPTIGPPIKLSATPGGVRRPAPAMGEHTRSILTELGFDEGGAAALFASGAVA
jgi:crotonobetainyl-CoA:carnitine CoA-transferase CaiB-like acyl-CoA transferase